MRSPIELRSPRETSAAGSANQQEDEEGNAQSPGALRLPIDKESEDEREQTQAQPSPVRPAAGSRVAVALPNRPATEPRTKRSGSRQQLLERTRSRIRRFSQPQPAVSEGGTETSDTLSTQTNVNFAEEIENEAAEIRTLIARTAQLWSAVDRAEHADVLPTVLPQPSPRAPASTTHTSLAAQYVCEADGTLSSDDEEYQGEDEAEETETESATDIALENTDQVGEYLTDDETCMEELSHDDHSTVPSSTVTLDQTRLMEEEHNMNTSESGEEHEDADEERGALEYGNGGLQLRQGEIMDASNRAINASKARAIKNAMLGNFVRLGFRDNITRAALEAGVLEIDHYDSDCELAYVDIFMSLVKMVCDAHVDVINESNDFGLDWASHDNISGNHEQNDTNMSFDLEQRSFLPFKWPVFDMAQFEFGNARPGTCFNSICVLTNLPKVSMDRTEELMEVLSYNLFCMIGDPIQVVIPSASSTGRTKGHAFLEFDDPDMAKRCASAVDGLTWGRGPFGRIRGNLFRQYQVKSAAEELPLTHSVNEDGASLLGSYSGISVSGALSDDSPRPDSAFDRHGNRVAERFRPNLDHSGEIHQQNLLCDSDEDSSDEGRWVVNQRLEYTPFNPPLRDLSSASVDIRDQFEHVQRDGITMQLGWDGDILDEGYSVRMSSEGGGGDDHSQSFDSSSALEMDQSLIDGLVRECRFNDSLNEFVRECSRYENSRNSPAQVSLSSDEAQLASSTVTSTASVVARENLEDCSMVDQSWGEHEGNYGVEKPWRRYCEDLIVRNREMQEQMAFARRRIVQLSHNNQKLHLLIDRVERDRDGLLFENDLLQSQLHGYEDHEEHHDSLMKELVMLRKHLKHKEQSFVLRPLDPNHDVQTASYRSRPSNVFQGNQPALLSPTALENCKMDELKEWEHQLETSLSHVRNAKEEKALEMQKKLDRQVEEQNELKLCVICLADEKTILCLPCRHLCLCKTCSRREEVTKCPICRLEIEEILAVYS